MTAAETFWTLLEQRASTTPGKLFAIDERDRAITFAQFRLEALRAADSLLEAGIEAGSVVSWMLPTWTETFVLLAALARIGAVQNPIVPILREREVGFITRQVRATLLITPGVWRKFDYAAMAGAVAEKSPGLRTMVFERAFAAPLAEHADRYPAGQADRSRWCFYSSGTTSDPKGAMHTDRSLIAAARAMVEGLQLTHEDRLPVAFPVTHIAGTIYLLGAMLTGCSLALAEGFHAVDTLDQFSRQGITLGGPGTPFLLAFLKRQRELGDTPLFPRARAFLSGGAPKSPTLHAEIQAVLKAPLLSSYGLTEAPMLTYTHVDDAAAVMARTEGRALPTVDIAIVVNGSRVATGAEGEVRVKGPQVMLRYVDQQVAADAFDGEGFLRTGDVGRLDEHGNLTITGRIKEIIIRNMENISATELEGLLHTHSGVREVAVIGLADPRTGERVCAVIVPADAASPPSGEDLCKHLLSHGLSQRKLPEQFEYVRELPRNPMGKVLKAVLRAQFGANATLTGT